MYNLAQPDEVKTLYRFYSVIQGSRHMNVRFEIGEDINTLDKFMTHSFILLFKLIAQFPQTLPARLSERRATFYKLRHEVRKYDYYVYGKRDVNWKFCRKTNKDIHKSVQTAVDALAAKITLN